MMTALDGDRSKHDQHQTIGFVCLPQSDILLGIIHKAGMCVVLGNLMIANCMNSATNLRVCATQP